MGISESGLLVVSDSRSSRFHLFAPDGAHLSEFGRFGQGPGEFSRMPRFLFDGTLMHIFDRSLRRRTLLDLDGGLVSLNRYPDEFSNFGVAMPWAFLGSEENRIYLCELKSRSMMTNTYTYRIVLRDTALALVETPIDTAYSPGVVTVGGPGGRHFPFVLGWPESALASDLPLAWSWGREFRIDFLDVINKDRWAVHIPHEVLPVTSEHREDYLTRYYSREGLVEEARRKLPWPSHFPHLDRMRWDSTGRLWVLEYQDPLVEDPPWVYQVFGTDGTWLFRQELPMRIGFVDKDGMYVSEYDEADNSIIRFYRFESSDR